MFIARRLIESALAAEDGKLVLALEWSRAFDSVDPYGLVVVLARNEFRQVLQHDSRDLLQ